MPKNIHIKAIYREEIDIQGCVLALLALARELQPAVPDDQAGEDTEASND